MARRERTTGLPRPRPRTEGKGQKVGGVAFGEREQRLAIIGTAVLLLVVVIALFAWRAYDNTFRVPNKTVLSVADEKFALKYYADRLFLYAQQQQGSGISLTIAEQALIRVLEEEALIELIAKEKGITVSDEEITTEIAAQLGVPVGGAGSTFDTLYRQRLSTVSMDNATYRRYTEAQVWQSKLGDAYKAELGDTSEAVTLRTVVVATQAEATAVADRIKGGENLGTIAQTLSTDPTSRQRDGLMDAEPARLLPETVRTAIEGKAAGDEVIGPIEVSGSFWVFRVEKRDAAATLSETQKSQLADLMVEDAVSAKRAQTTIRRTFDSSDFRWAEENAGN